MGVLWVNGFSFFHCVASPFHSFVTTVYPDKSNALSGWTYEHVRAAGLYDKRTGEAMRGFVNDILSGAIPHFDLLLPVASRLIALEKPHGGVRPILSERRS